MAMLARYGDCFACLISQPRIDRGSPFRCADMHRMVRGCDLCWFGFDRRRRLMICGDTRATNRSGQEYD